MSEEQDNKKEYNSVILVVFLRHGNTEEHWGGKNCLMR